MSKDEQAPESQDSENSLETSSTSTEEGAEEASSELDTKPDYRPDDNLTNRAPAVGTGEIRGLARTKSFATSRPVAVTVVFLAAIVFGALSYLRLSVTLMPELSYPTLTVRTEYPGAAPEEVENEVSRPVEEALGVINGLKRISSVSRADVSDVILEFSWDTDVSEALQDSLEKLDQVFLPQEAGRPLILRFDPSLDPVMELSLSGDGERFAGEEGLRRLRRLAELQVKRALEPIKGVAAVQIRGGLEEEIHVRLDAAQLTRIGISPEAVINRIQNENINLAGGTLKEGSIEYMVRTLNEYTDLGQIEETVVSMFENKPVRVRDVGSVVRAHRERQIVTHTDGAPSVQLEIYKEADANMVAVSRRVVGAIGTVPEAEEVKAPTKATGQRGPPGPKSVLLAEQIFKEEGASLRVAADRSVFIASSIDEVRNSAILGGFLAVLVLYLFLRDFRTTTIVAVSIPVSLVITFAPLHLTGTSLNIMSLGGLALGVGMLVDSSIVVLESIFRCREEGDSFVAAVVRGTVEVRGAVIASTLTSIAVFFPMVFVEGVAGQAFGDLGLAVVISLIASLVVALFLIPMLAARKPKSFSMGGFERPSLAPVTAFEAYLRDREAVRGAKSLAVVPYLWVRTFFFVIFEVLSRLIVYFVLLVTTVITAVALIVGRYLIKPFLSLPMKAVGRGMAATQDLYRGVLNRALKAPGTVALLVVLCLALTVWGFLSLPSELLPEVHQGELTFELALPTGTPLEETEKILGPLEKAILESTEEIESVIVTYGFDPTQSKRSDEGEHTARFRLLLKEADPRKEALVVERIRQSLESIPDLSQRVTRPVLFSFRTPIEVEVHGQNLRELARLAERTETVMAEMPELADVSSSLRRGAPEVEVVYDRERLARWGLDVATTAERVRDLIQGREASRFNLPDRRIPIVVQLQESDRHSVEDIRNLVVNPGGDRPIQLSSLAEVRLGDGPSEVRRVDGRRVALVSANLGSGSLGEAAEAIESRLASEIRWPEDMTFLVSGQNQEWERSKASLWVALALSIFLVYVIMASQFESLIHPLVILFSIPLAFLGTIGILKVFSLSLSVVVFLGMIMLAGIVVNNAIVLVDYINTLRLRGLSRDDAILEAGQVRMRPILMTTATTVLGLIPMAVGMGDGAEIRTPMALAVIGGLTVSTVLTLVVIPVVYSLLDRLKENVLSGAASSPNTEVEDLEATA